MKNLADKIIFYFSFLLIVYLPFQSLIENSLQNKLALSASYSYWISHFYEPLIGIVALVAIIDYCIAKPRPKLNFAAVSFVIYSALLVFLIASPLTRGVEGFKIDSLPIVMFLVASVAKFKKRELDILISTYLVVALTLALWAVVERFLPLNYWSVLGIGSFGWGQFGFGQFSFGPLFQSASFIGWPNQLASYLLPAFFITLVMKRGRIRWLELAVFFAAIVLAFSRASWLGLAFSLFMFIVFFIKERKTKVISFIIFGLVLLALLGLYFRTPAIKNILDHTSSATATVPMESHSSALHSTISEIRSRLHKPATLIFGSGLGMAGPLVLKYHTGFVPESWYFQLILEAGIIGLVLWLALLYALLRQSFRKNRGIFLALVAVSITSIFLHTWADNPALAYTILLLAGSAETLKISA